MGRGEQAVQPATETDESTLRERLGGAPALWAGVAAVLLLHLLLAYLLFDPKPFIGGDNAAYMTLAESLRTGQGYRDLYLPSAPRHAQYPPLYPAILALVGGMGGGLIVFKVLSGLLTAGSVLILFLLARSRLRDSAALAVTVPFALSPLLLYYSHWVLSEAAFVTLTLLALFAAERSDEEESVRERLWFGVSVGGAVLAYLTRAAGLPLILALLVVVAWRRQPIRLGALAAAVAPVLVGWWVWGRAVGSENPAVYGSNFLLVNPYAPEQGFAGPGDLLVRVVENLRLYSVEVLPQALAGRQPPGPLALLALLTALAVLALAVVAWGRSVRKPRALEAFTFFYFGLLCVWPQVWTDQRFLLPLLPVVLLYAGMGLVWCFDFMRWERPRWAIPAFCALLALLALPDVTRTALENRACVRLYRQGDRLACYPPAWRAFVQSAEWVRDNTAADAIVISRKPRLFYYFARRRGDVYPFTTDESEMQAFLDSVGADFVVVAGLSATTFRYLVPFIRSKQDRFVLAHRVGEGPGSTYVLAYRAPPGGTSEPEGR